MAGSLTISTLNNDTGVLATQNGMTGIAKAWVRFQGGNPPTILKSFNISSVIFNLTGQYTINITTAMSGTTYSAVFSTGISTGFNNGLIPVAFGLTVPPYYEAPTTSSFRLSFINVSGNAWLDPNVATVAIFD
jgi:hypothetical protein